MSQDSYRVTSSTSWFGRIGSSIKGVVIGLILLVISFPVLFFNEGRAVSTRKSLEQGEKSLVNTTADAPDPKNDGKLVYFTGEAKAQGELTDPDFQVSAEALRLERVTEYYLWQEQKKTETKKKLGGGEETVETYSYKKAWVNNPIDSSSFHRSADYSNPQPAIRGASWSASPVTVGEYTLSAGLVSQIDNFTNLGVADEGQRPETLGGKKVQLVDGGFYLGANPSSPEVGDVRVSYQVALPGTVSVIAQQHSGNQLEAFKADAGDTIQMLETGSKSSQAMFQTAHDNNKIMTWVLRLVGFALMFIGFCLLMKPLSVLADVVPLFGNIVEAGTGIIALLLSGTISFTVIAVAWIFYRPLIGIPLIVLAGVAAFLLIKKLSAAKRAIRQPAAAQI